MAQHLPVIGPADDMLDADPAPRAPARLSPRDFVRQARERETLAEEFARLFEDADQHGPRWPVLVLRIVPALLLVAFLVLLASTEPWRRMLIERLAPGGADMLLVAPVLASVVVLAAAMAPLARTRALPLLAAGLVVLAGALQLVAHGWLVAATAPAVVAATLLGIAAARVVRRAVWTLPLLVAAAASDAHSVQRGVTDQLLDGVATHEAVATVQPHLGVAPELVQRIDFLVLHVPAATGTWLLGMVDVLAVGMLLGLAHLLWLPVPRTAAALAAALVLTVALGTPVPVLPALGAAWVLVNARLVWRSTRFSLRRLTYLGG